MLMSKLFTAIKGAFSPGNTKKRRREDMKENEELLEDRVQEQRKKLEPAAGQIGILEEQPQPTLPLGGEDGQPNSSKVGKYGNLLASVDATEKFGWRRFPTPRARQASWSARKDLPTSEPGSAIKGSVRDIMHSYILCHNRLYDCAVSVYLQLERNKRAGGYERKNNIGSNNTSQVRFCFISNSLS